MGTPVTVGRCYRELEKNADGFSNVSSLVAVALNHGLRARAYFADMKGLTVLDPPFVLHWRGRHFVVFEAWSKTANGCMTASIVDPYVGRREVDVAVLEREYSGAVVTFESLATNGRLGSRSFGKMVGYIAYRILVFPILLTRMLRRHK